MGSVAASQGEGAGGDQRHPAEHRGQDVGAARARAGVVHGHGGVHHGVGLLGAGRPGPGLVEQLVDRICHAEASFSASILPSFSRARRARLNAVFSGTPSTSAASSPVNSSTLISTKASRWSDGSPSKA